MYSFLTLFFFGSLRLFTFLCLNCGKNLSQLWVRNSESLANSRLIIKVFRHIHKNKILNFKTHTIVNTASEKHKDKLLVCSGERTNGKDVYFKPAQLAKHQKLSSGLSVNMKMKLSFPASISLKFNLITEVLISEASCGQAAQE